MKEKLGNFELIEPIDPGGYTLVYRAVEHMGQGITRPAAVKVLQAWNLDDTEQLDILRREVEVLVDIGTSPNIVAIYGFGIDEEAGPWIALELAGRNLKHFIADHPVEPDQVRLLLRDTLRALSVVHGAQPQILHRDIKPNNILSSQFGVWKIADFGLAKRRESDGTLNVMTVQYAAPELLDATLGPESPKMDLYSLGMVTYEYALGRKLYRQQFPSVYDPFADDQGSGADDRPKWMYWHTSPQMTIPPLAEIIPDYPQDTSDLIAAMTAKPLRERIGSADEALASLGDVHAPVAMSAVEAAATDEEREDRSNMRTLLLALAVIIIIVVVFALMIPQVLTARPVITLAGEGTFSANQPSIVVTGHIDHYPRSGAATVTLRSGNAFPVYVDDDGSFTCQVELERLGETEGALVITDRSGQPAARKLFSLQRTEPETVHVVLQTKPSASGADIVITQLSDPDRPIRLHTNANGQASAEVKHGQFEVEITHPRYRRLIDTADTGIDPERRITASLALLSQERLHAKREKLLTEMDRVAEAAAAGDAEAVARLQAIRRELKQLEPVEGDTVAARRVALLEELDEVAARAAAGDPEAAARLKAINAELRELAQDTSDGQSPGGQPSDPGGRAARRQQLITEMDAVVRRAATGDPQAIARLQQIRSELASLEEDDASPAQRRRNARRTQLLRELDDVTRRAAAGDPQAVARLREIQRELQAIEDEQQGQGPLTGRDARRARLVSEMADVARRAAAGDPNAIARLREIRTELQQLEEQETGGSAISRRRADLLNELAVMTELAAAGDPDAIARVEEIQRQLAALTAIETAEGDPARLAAAASQMIGGVPAIELLDRTTLLQLTTDQFKAFIEVNVPTGALIVERVPQLSKVRISGPVFNDDELTRLLNRLAPAEPRLQLEVRVDPWAVCRQLARQLRERGADDPRVHAYLAVNDNTIFVQFKPSDTLGEDAVTALARTFVLDRDLVFVQRF